MMLWLEVGNDPSRMCQEALDAKHIEGQVNAELIKLIPKGAKKNTRVLEANGFANVSYKVLPKVLANRIKNTAARIVHMSK
jgi:hypothetical protein